MDAEAAKLAKRLASPDKQERCNACEALGELGERADEADVIGELTKRLADEHYDVRRAASRALAKIQEDPPPEQCQRRNIHLKPDKWAGSVTRRELPKPGGAFRG